jgi:hypothetical protein
MVTAFSAHQHLVLLTYKHKYDKINFIMISKETLFSQETLEHVALVAGGMAAGGLGVKAYMKSMIRDRGFRVFAAKDEAALKTVLEITSEHGLKPRRRIEDKGVLRALLEDNVTVINATDQEAREEIGSPTSAIMMKAKHPLEAAEHAASLLIDRGYEATIIDQSAISQDTQGEMVFLATNAMEDGVNLGFRQHVTKMGPMPPRWKD